MDYELYYEPRNDYYIEEYRNAPWDDDYWRNAGFGEEWRNQQRRYAPPGNAPAGGTRIIHHVPTPPPRPAVVARPQHHMPVHHEKHAPANITCGKSVFRNELGQIRAGVIIDAVAQTLAAFTPLPPQPAADQYNAAANSANALIYLGALANHAKTDEKIRTVSKLLQLFVTN